MASLRWTDRARRDLGDIRDYISRREGEAASRFVEGLLRRSLILEEQPRSGRRVPEFNTDDIRELIHGNYRIVYKLAGSEVHILTVFEGHMLLDPAGFEENTT
ncbi:MAG: type II toxin-antitoxin system RelE/ParE family toxin [Rectinemataceae bacterium]